MIIADLIIIIIMSYRRNFLDQSSCERLAEYGWKPHRYFSATQKNNRRPQFTGMCVKHRGYGFNEFEFGSNLGPPASESRPLND